MRIAMWSGPRNLSTAMMYAFAARSDCAVVDEPFYAAYLKESGEVHPMQEAILASQPQHASEVIAQCLGPVPDGKDIFYQKHMSHHMLPAFPLAWTDDVINVFLLRHPARVIASYNEKREKPLLDDIGIRQQAELFNRQMTLNGEPPVVIDSDDLLTDPATGLQTLCEAIGISYDAGMLSWPAGGNKADGVWAEHWYNAVWESTGLIATARKPVPVLSETLQEVCEQALPYYYLLEKYKLTF